MRHSELNNALKQHPDAALAFVLPDGSAVAPHFHVTEVGRVRKDFIDCGGTPRQTDACVLQVWVADDVEHRLRAGKLGTIVALGDALFGDADLPVEIEYDVGVITQFALAGIDADHKQITLKLAGKHTACLAPDLCGVDDASGESSSGGCCSSPMQSDSMISLGVNQGKCC